jgi:hypothetical protein
VRLRRRPQAPEEPCRSGLAHDCTVDGCILTGTAHRHLDLAAPMPASDMLEPREQATPLRPVPATNAWPDDAVLLTYAELRGLVSLHLDLVRECMPRTEPWGWVEARARAMRDGETPLLLSEVMER